MLKIFFFFNLSFMGDSEENISNFLNAPLKSAIYTRAVELALKQTAI